MKNFVSLKLIKLHTISKKTYKIVQYDIFL